ncbi:hypothetical protein V2J09_016035 [Rumex salicifolius]
MGWRCLNWGSFSATPPSESTTFSLPAPLPQWPLGEGFSTGTINLGELEVAESTKFELVCSLSHNRRNRVSFYKPVGIPEGFSCLGYYCQSSNKTLHGSVHVARQSTPKQGVTNCCQPALSYPLDYTLVWCSDDRSQRWYESPAYFWVPEPPQGYKAIGFAVTNNPSKPDLEELRCVREDLTDNCEGCGLLLERSPKSGAPFRVWKTRPCHRGLEGKGVCVGTFFCSTSWTRGENPVFVCLKNSDPLLSAMPNLDQIHALISHYGPTLFFHPKEKYLPSSVSWFFENGALLYKKGESKAQPIDATGSNLPSGDSNDHEFWLDLPSGDKREMIKRGSLETAILYVHVKPALGGTFTDIVMWVFCPFNGPSTIKVGPVNLPLDKVGQHVGDWEHFTLRISNFSGILRSVYFSQHSGGVWIEACELEYIEGNRPVVYSSKGGHASFPRPGCFLQGSSELGIGIRNDCARSGFYVDSSKQYQIVAAEYLKGEVSEPPWLQFMREWGPVVIYDSRKDLDKAIKRFPAGIRLSLINLFEKIPGELYKEEGPTGPKEKNNWLDDERW